MHDTLKPRILRIFAFFMICTAGLNVLPAVAAASVGNCLALLDAQQPFMVKAGCSRLQLLMRLDAAREQAAAEGAAPKLLKLVAPSTDAGERRTSGRRRWGPKLDCWRLDVRSLHALAAACRGVDAQQFGEFGSSCGLKP